MQAAASFNRQRVEKPLTHKQELAIVNLLSKPTMKDAAVAVGVNEATLWLAATTRFPAVLQRGSMRDGKPRHRKNAERYNQGG